MPNFIQTISNFKKMNTNTEIFITEDNNLHTISQVKEQKLEAGLVIWPEGYPEKNQDILFHPMAKGRFVLCVNKKIKHAKKDLISSTELKDLSVFLYEDPFVQQFVVEYEKKHGKLNILFTSNQADAARNGLLTNLGVLIGPSFTFISDPHIKSGVLTTLEVNEFQTNNLYLGWVTLPKMKLQEETKQFIKLFNHYNSSFSK